MRSFLLAACLLCGSAQAAHDPAAEVDAAAARYQSEWWRLTASLADREGRLWGLEWALYRQRGAGSAPQSGGISLAHVAITTPDGEYHEQRFEHGGMVRADSAAPRQTVTGSDRGADWEWVSQGAALFPARLSFSVGDRDLNLLLDSRGGTDSAAEQPATQGSGHAVSEPLIRVRGFVDQGSSKTYLRGQGRLDREWQTPLLAGNLAGGD